MVSDVSFKKRLIRSLPIPNEMERGLFQGFGILLTEAAPGGRNEMAGQAPAIGGLKASSRSVTCTGP
jgi:hypothetical protein